ncbi:hypothetical protein A5666_00015 [Mycolicibacterium fortuitum]|uniref:hypothetical protein n=1 Tax=Mycolicibacterium fortuitum TaxID=1766 RepID=UPI0007EA8735|nr:hypothetical protein [Mycolicibacterium fortuitum]OBA92963.1 hypothetical protein A5665_10655 [Mycolicibacterium fortuitum]OBI66912.1 hypothetical protein A5666_00015 [Mycolicibacterium fortuitum]
MTTTLFAQPTSCSYTDRAVYQLLLEIAARADIQATALSFDPTDAHSIDYGDRRATVWPTEDGDKLEWELLVLPRRGGWRVTATGSGNDSDMRTAVVSHLRGDDVFRESAAS